MFRFSIGCIDVKGAYIRSGPIKRAVYVRPPSRWIPNRGILWRLTKPPYGIGEAGRQWAKTFERWLLEEAGLERVYGVFHLYVKRDASGRLIFLVAKVTDDLMMAG